VDVAKDSGKFSMSASIEIFHQLKTIKRMVDPITSEQLCPSVIRAF
jgi:hypothetical protein